MRHTFARICWDNNILQFATYCMSGSGPLAAIIFAFGVVKSIFCVAVRHLCDDLDDVDQCKSNDCIRMSLEKKHVSDSVSIVSLFIGMRLMIDIFC